MILDHRDPELEILGAVEVVMLRVISMLNAAADSSQVLLKETVADCPSP